MKKFGQFIAIGSAFATVEEFFTLVILNRDVGSYLLTLFIVFPVFLTGVFFSSKLLDRMFRSAPAREVAHILVYGLVGLMFEWFVMGLSPWSNKNAPALLMFAFQIGMFCFWSGVSFAPRIFLGEHVLHRRVARQILCFYIPYFAVAYAVGLAVPIELRFGTVIGLIVIGYFILNLFFVKYLVQANASEPGELRFDPMLSRIRGN